MKKLDFTLASVWIFFFAFPQSRQPVDYADPLLSTSESRWMLNPGATMPFGMVQLSPDNKGGAWKLGYEYNMEKNQPFNSILLIIKTRALPSWQKIVQS